MNELPLIARARAHGDRLALRSGELEFSYRQVIAAADSVAVALLGGGRDLGEARVAFLAPSGFEYIAILWGIWQAGGIAVPLGVSAKASELEHALVDAGVDHVITLREHADQFESLGSGLPSPILFEELDPSARCPMPEVDPGRRAMILFTSGTTNRPKGVVTTHANIRAQIESLVEAWQWSGSDRIPLFLPMHHIHGIINVACCALWVGASIECFPKFEAGRIIGRVGAGAYTVFMAVPTIYVLLIEMLESRRYSGEARERILKGFMDMRLMVSGSAALPASVHEKWTVLTGQKLLERYGMTETGMILSNPLDGERRPGAVGRPLPGVQVRCKSDAGQIIDAEGEPGEIQVRGPGVFQEYWNRQEATAEAFDEGWFRTGDVAVMERGYYRIMGRLSIDIIKSGGYKLSALEIESVLLDHPAIRECAVVGVKDDTWSELVGVAAVLKEGAPKLSIEELRRWSMERLSQYKLPRRLLLVDSLPRNAMGKVSKRMLARTFDE